MPVGNDQCGIVPIKCEGNKEPCTIAKPRYAILSSKDMVDLESISLMSVALWLVVFLIDFIII